MPEIYTSIFKTLPVVTKKDMCALLNLDLARPNLSFSKEEINKAYRIRARQFHPDRQYLAPYPIPAATCTILMDDLSTCRDHLLNGKDDIIGASLSDNSMTDWLSYVLKMLKTLKNDSSDVTQSIVWYSRFSRSVFMMVALSTFSDGQLNLRYVNQLTPQMNHLRAMLATLDSDLIVSLLRMIQQYVNMDEFDEQNVRSEIQGLVSDELISREGLRVLVSAIHQAQAALKVELTDDLIWHIEHLLKFWPDFINRLPSWNHLSAILFITLLTTATSLPKYVNAVRVLAETILEQKGGIALTLSNPLLLLLSVALLPINLAIQLSAQLVWITAKVAFTIITNVFTLLLLPYNIVFAESCNTELLFALLNGVVALSLRLIVTCVLELADSVLFILTDTSSLSSWIDSFNHHLDELLKVFKPVSSYMPERDAEKNNGNDELVLVIADNEQSSTAAEQPPVLPFFAQASLHNNQDDFLQNIYNHIAKEDRMNDTALKA